jgi:hypothetical protein
MDTEPETPPMVRDLIGDAISFWEKGRIAYNVVLVLLVLGLLTVGGRIAKAPLTDWLLLAILAVGANLCYSLAYIPDLFVQASTHRAAWRRWGRPALWVVGTIASACAAALFGSSLFFRMG